MKKVSLRDFQLKPTAYVNDLPLILTRYGRDIAQVIRIDEKGQTFIPPETEESTETLVAKSPKVNWGYCQLRWHNQKFPLKLCKLEGIDGNTLWEKQVCPGCIVLTSKETLRNGGVFYIEGVRQNE